MIILCVYYRLFWRNIMKKEFFGKLPDGRELFLFIFSNKNGVEVKITNYGGIITSIVTPDKFGKLSDIVLGFNKLEDYLNGHPYFGAIIGRFGNRIKNGKFTLNGTEYKLALNDGNNHLHGGIFGFDKVLWNYEITEVNGLESLKLSYLSKEGEEGYPGNLNITVCYSLTDTNELNIEYYAVTDKDTVVNLTNHSYFNLSGSDTILNHELKINADRFTPIDTTLIPTGELRLVNDTPLDFKTFKVIGQRIDDDYDQLKYGNGYDHNFILNKNDNSLSLAAEVFDPIKGRTLEVSTTEPAIQFYSGNFLDGSLTGKEGKTYIRRGGLCLETQHYPDSPNKPDFPNVILKPGNEYKQTTIYKFGIR